MDINTIRRDNLRRLADKSRNHAAFAKKLGISRSYLGQIIGANPRKGIGNKKARAIETLLELARGWLDTQHDFAGLDPDMFITAVELAEDIMRSEKIDLEPRKRARIYLLVYSSYQSANVDPRNIRDLILLAS